MSNAILENRYNGGIWLYPNDLKKLSNRLGDCLALLHILYLIACVIVNIYGWLSFKHNGLTYYNLCMIAFSFILALCVSYNVPKTFYTIKYNDVRVESYRQIFHHGYCESPILINYPIYVVLLALNYGFVKKLTRTRREALAKVKIPAIRRQLLLVEDSFKSLDSVSNNLQHRMGSLRHFSDDKLVGDIIKENLKEVSKLLREINDLRGQLHEVTSSYYIHLDSLIRMVDIAELGFGQIIDQNTVSSAETSIEVYKELANLVDSSVRDITNKADLLLGLKKK